jgi:hypothetical protein
MLHATRVHRFELGPPPCQQAQAFLPIANFITQVIGPTAEGIDVVEVLVQALR